MNFFTSLKTAEFAAKLFSAAGLDLAAIAKAGDENALKAHLESAIAAAVAAAPAKVDAELTTKVGTLEAALTSAKATNDAVTAALGDVGFKAPAAKADETPEQAQAAFKAALESHIKIRAQGILAQTGHAAVAEVASKKAPASLTRAAFNALSPVDQMEFSTNGGRLTE